MNPIHRAAAEHHLCDYCHMPPGQTCRDKTTGRELTRQPAHLTRLRAAGIDLRPRLAIESPDPYAGAVDGRRRAAGDDFEETNL